MKKTTIDGVFEVRVADWVNGHGQKVGTGVIAEVYGPNGGEWKVSFSPGILQWLASREKAILATATAKRHE